VLQLLKGCTSVKLLNSWFTRWAVGQFSALATTCMSHMHLVLPGAALDFKSCYVEVLLFAAQCCRMQGCGLGVMPSAPGV
jgi:hypothetical protein